MLWWHRIFGNIEKLLAIRLLSLNQCTPFYSELKFWGKLKFTVTLIIIPYLGSYIGEQRKTAAAKNAKCFKY